MKHSPLRGGAESMPEREPDETEAEAVVVMRDESAIGEALVRETRRREEEKKKRREEEENEF